MKLTRNQRKWLKRIIIPLCILLLIRGFLYYIVAYRFKEVIQLVVKKETKGLYSFEASTVRFSLWKKSISLQDVSLHCNDTLHTSPHYAVNISDVYVDIESWTDILLHRQVSVDSISIIMPEITVHEHQPDKTKQILFRPGRIFDLLKEVGSHLQIRSFNIVDASFNYSNNEMPATFASNHINLQVKNFSRKSMAAGNLLSSEDIDLLVTGQHWVLPDGIHEINFSKLHFSGKDPYFELDSCSFHTQVPGKKAFLTLEADQVRFTSKQLAAIYEQEQLLIDTLICFRPVLHLQTAQSKTMQADTSTAISRTLQQLFKGVRFNYVDVRDGTFLVDEKNIYKPTYATQKTNLTIYNLNIRPDSTKIVSTDSIHLSVSSIKFYTTDSSYMMGIDEFELKNNNVLFKNAVFMPTAGKNENKDLVFRTPLLLMKNINLESLMKKELNASTAELFSPVIMINNRQKNRISVDSAGINAQKAIAKKSNFYKTLHGLGELIRVRHFKITGGSVHYRGYGKVPATAELTGLNTDILLEHFLKSDSFMSIKRSIPELKAASIQAQTPEMSLFIKNYTFHGGYRHNSIDEFRLSLKNGSSFRGTDLYWELFDWDLLQNYRIIQIESLRIGQLAIDMHPSNREADDHSSEKLPQFRLNRFDLGDLKLSLEYANKSKLELNAGSVCMDSISTRNRFLEWKTILSTFNNVSFTNDENSLFVKSINLDNEHSTSIEGTRLDLEKNGLSAKIIAPFISLRTDVHSTDFLITPLQSILLENPRIIINNNSGEKKSAKKIMLPVQLQGAAIEIRNGEIQYSGEKNSEPLSFKGNMDLKTTRLSSFKTGDPLLQFDSIALKFSDIQFLRKETDVSIPASSIILSSGNITVNAENKITLESSIGAKWTNVAVRQSKGDSVLLTLQHANAGLADPHFRYVAGTRFRWKGFLHVASISDAAIHFRNKTITANAASFNWDPKAEHLGVDSFSIIPNQDMVETFKKQLWQADYIMIRGDALDLSGIHYQHEGADTSVYIGLIDVTNLNLTTARDKRIPFQHGIEKPMPTKLILQVKYPFRVDSLRLHDASVTVTEISNITNLQGTIPLEKLNGLITTITNRPKPTDSLMVKAEAKLFTNYIRSFNYKESYKDSLSGFRLRFTTSPMVLTEYSQVTTPLAALIVKKGNSDTLYARWTGNKHAAFGSMDFYYNDLRVKLLDKQNPAKQSLLLALENTLANTLLLNKNNSSYSRVYFERDKEKFIFNYWIKTSLRGMMSSVGIKSNRSYYKAYLKSKDIYSLPLETD